MYMQKNSIQIFENEEFGQIRVIDIDGVPWWVLTDICKILGLSNPSSVALKLDEDEKLKVDPKSNLGSRSNTPLTVINESGLYAVILRSDKPNAKVFRKWVTSEILPTIRKHGAYIHDDLLRRIQEDGECIDELVKRLVADREKMGVLLDFADVALPKVRYHDLVLRCPEAVQVSIIAKDFGMSAVAFNKLLYKLGVQYRVGKTWLLYAKYQGNGYTITNTYTRNGMVTLVHTCFTQRGRLFLYNLLKSHGILPEVERIAQHEQMTFEEAGA
jgi:prophage antirepressor-like protein